MTDAEPLLVLDDRARGCVVTYERAFLARAEADALFARLRSEAPFRAERPVMFGRAITVRRESCAFGAPGTRYRYSGLERAAEPWPPWLAPLLERLRAHVGARFDFVLCNHYPDGRAGLGWHADDEDDLRDGAPIASISLGAERDFALREGRSGRALRTLTLAHGSLLLMRGATQRHYQHRVPVRARCVDPRVNLTFRVLR